MNKLLWLDDLRNPYLDEAKTVPDGFASIDWVLNYEQFVKWIEKYGLPTAISFDHDLADEHYTPEEYWHPYEVSKSYQDAQTYQEKTGMDCAKWLVEYCMDNSKTLPKFYVHSANPVGADNILGILNNYNKFTNQLNQLKELKNPNVGVWLGDGNLVGSGSVMIGSYLTCNNNNEIVIGHGDDNCLRLKENGDLYWKGEQVEHLSDDVVKEFSKLFKEIIDYMINGVATPPNN